MKIAILSLYTVEHAPLNLITAPSKQKYADKWGYTFINHFGVLDEDRPASWSKIPLILEHLKSFDWIYWIDADAMIMNSSIPLENIIRDYDLIMVQERRKSHFNTFQLNAGGFFVRNRPWAHRFLEKVNHLDKFREHIYWDQAAIRHALENDPEACNHVYVETEPKTFNAFVDSYGKGDFVFHAVSFSTSVELKEKLLRRTVEEDRRIPVEHQPKLTLLYLVNPLDDTSQLLGEFAIPSIIQTNLGGTDLTIRVVNAIPSELCQKTGGPQFAALVARIQVITEVLRQHKDEHLIFSRPDTQFLRTNWKRFCLVELGDADGLFLENGAHRDKLGDSFFFIRATQNVLSFFDAIEAFLETTLRTGDTSRAQSFAELLPIIQPSDYACRFKPFPQKEVKNTADSPQGTELFTLAVHSVECMSDLNHKRNALSTVKTAYTQVLQSLMNLRLED